jgi:cardiolipin synthase (CMP-forming)
VPLAVIFPLVVERPVLAVLVLVVSGASDVVDGWLARSRNQATATGAVVDPITDKLFVASVVATLVVTDRLPLVSVPLLAARDLGELPLVLWWSLSRKQRRARAEHPAANVPGKLATALQFAVVAAALIRPDWTYPLLIAAGVMGVVAAASYARRELARTRARNGEPGR